MKAINYAMWLIGLLLGLMGLLFSPVSVATAATGPTSVSETEFVRLHNRTLCYNGISVRMYRISSAIEAGLVANAAEEGRFVTTHGYVSWGPCVNGNGAVVGQARLGNSQPVVYVTACDDMSTIGGMRISYGFINDGIQEANVVYLIYALDDDPCRSGLDFVTETNTDWYESCLVQPLRVVYDPTGRSSFDMGTGPIAFRCDAAGSLD